MMAWALHPAVVMRPEPRALLLFQRQTAELLELDAQGLDALRRLLTGHPLRHWRAWVLRNHLVARRFLRRTSDWLSQAEGERVWQQAQSLQAPLRSLVAPEALHISITQACDQACSGCFFSAPLAKGGMSMPLALFTQIVDQAARVKVFQLALGGGEPMTHPDLETMVAYATERGLLVSMTTNGNHLTPFRADALRQAGLGQLQFSLNGATPEVHSQTRPHYERVRAAIRTAQAAHLRWGLNTLVTRANLSALEDLLRLAQAEGAYSVNILRPKPAQRGGKWLAESLPSAADNRFLQTLLRRWQPRLRITTDSSLAFVRQGTPQAWRYSGVEGCTAGRRILSIDPSGQVLPCGHVPIPAQVAPGDFMAAWNHDPQLDAFRRLEETLGEPCQSCVHKSVCRGCRAVAEALTRDFHAGDPGCPKIFSTLS
jgi:radical SAM protein with 4Fe4S-binding SPASM domain